MFCPKCGGQNPDEGKFCRSCGTDLGNVSKALAPQPQQLLNHKGKPIHLEGAMKKLFTGIAFLIVTIALAFSQAGRDWWFWMLIPAFGMIGTGIAQYMQIRQANKGLPVYTPTVGQNALGSSPDPALPQAKTEWVSPESKYKTGDLVPPSVTENTTRQLEIDKEGQTMALPKE